MTWKGQRVLVAGATGLVGANLVRRLADEGARVRGTWHRREPVIADERIDYLRADLTNAADCRRAVQGVRQVFLCAAGATGGAGMAPSPLSQVTPNVLMNTLMLEAAYEAGVEKFVWLSSTVAYPVTERPVKEEELFDGEPFEKYYFVGWVKRFTEVLCRMYGEKVGRPLTTLVLRPTNVYGPHDDFELATAHVIPSLIRKVVERRDPLEVWGTGNDVRDVIYVDDLVEAMLRAAEKLNGYTTLNIGLGQGHTVKEILQTILEVDGYTQARVTFNADRPSMIPVRLVDTSKAERLLDWRARTDLREGLRRTIAWYRARQGVPA